MLEAAGIESPEMWLHGQSTALLCLRLACTVIDEKLMGIKVEGKIKKLFFIFSLSRTALSVVI